MCVLSRGSGIDGVLPRGRGNKKTLTSEVFNGLPACPSIYTEESRESKRMNADELGPVENTKLTDCYYEKKDWRLCKAEVGVFVPLFLSFFLADVELSKRNC